jgi:hypothetical protein
MEISTENYRQQAQVGTDHSVACEEAKQAESPEDTDNVVPEGFIEGDCIA